MYPLRCQQITFHLSHPPLTGHLAGAPDARPLQPERHRVLVVWLPILPYLHLAEPLASGLSAEEQERAARFRFPIDQRRYLLAHLLLRLVLAESLGLNPRAIEFRHNPYGKPTVVESQLPPNTPFGFSLSHSAQHVAVAVAAQPLVGVDIESLRPIQDALGLADRYFSSGERAWLRQLPDPQLETGFLRIWTCKEAFVKALGLGLQYPLESFDVSPFEADRARLGVLEPDQGRPEDWTLRSTLVGGDQALLAVAAKLAPAEVIGYQAHLEWRGGGRGP